MQKLLVIVLTVIAFSASPLSGQRRPVPNTFKKQVAIPIGIPEPGQPTEEARGFLGLATTPTCTTIPQVSAANTFEDNSYTLDRDIAGKLKITWIGSGDISADLHSKVFVREIIKYATCDATDGSGTLQFGAAWRATVLVDENDVSGGVNFAIVAASATIHQRQVKIKAISAGWADAAAINKLTQVALQSVGAGLNVQTFIDFSTKVEAALTQVATSDVSSMNLIGFVPNIKSGELTLNLATSFALYRISQGYGCEDAIAAFPVKGPDVDQAIRGTYQAVANGCDASSDVVKAAAAKILNGLHFKK